MPHRHCTRMAYDVAIIGAGIAGASLAAALSVHMSVIVLEAEDQPGYHTTGRSAAFWSVTYGGPVVQPLSSASGPFLAHPPKSFSETGFLLQRGALMVGRAQDEAQIANFLSAFEGSGVALERLAAVGVQAHMPGVRAAWDRAVWEPSTTDIDVARLHAAYLRQAKQMGAVLATSQKVQGISRGQQGWTLSCSSEEVVAHRIINAAGAWADDVAQLAGIEPVGVTPFRRTMVQLEVAAQVPADLPLVVDINEQFYFKPDGPNRIWLSPHDETPSPPCDAAPEEMDVALAIARFEEVMDWPVVRVERTWAGLRNFAPDRLPVFGADRKGVGFFWCAGQGGFGIQTAPAIAALLAAEILGQPPGADYDAINPAAFAPGRKSLRSRA
jgi:D-arginine dehydrogenase